LIHTILERASETLQSTHLYLQLKQGWSMLVQWGWSRGENIGSVSRCKDPWYRRILSFSC
jgi:hypothetical protein